MRDLLYKVVTTSRLARHRIHDEVFISVEETGHLQTGPSDLTGVEVDIFTQDPVHFTGGQDWN